MKWLSAYPQIYPILPDSASARLVRIAAKRACLLRAHSHQRAGLIVVLAPDSTKGAQ